MTAQQFLRPNSGLLLIDEMNKTKSDVWVRVTDLLHSKEAEMYDYQIIITVIYVSLTLTLCRLLRMINRALVPGHLQEYVGDFLAAFQSIGCGLESGFVRNSYGTLAYCLQLYCLGRLASWTLGKSCSNPIGNLRKYLEGRQRLLRTVVLMMLQMTAGFLAFKYAMRFWGLRVSASQAARYDTTINGQCSTDLNVPVILGLLIELGAALVEFLISKATTKRFRFERYEQFAKSVFGIAITIVGLNLTGMYLNPANASAQNFGCRGTTIPEHILVYWCGPVLGTALGFMIHSKFSQALRQLRNSLRDLKTHKS